MDALRADRDLLAGTLDAATRAIESRFRRNNRRMRRLGAGRSLVAHGNALLELLKELRARADRAYSEAEAAGGNREKVAALRQMRRVVLVARHLEHALGWLDDKPERLGLGATYLLRELACQLISDDADLIEEPSDSPSYATLSWPFERLLAQSFERQQLDRVSHPVLLFFPRSEAGNALLLPLLVHELGHPAWLRHGLGDELWTTLEQSEEWSIVDAALNHPKIAREDLSIRLRERLEELFCDALACTLLGPSYLMAFVGWASVMGLAEARREHPPSILRMELMLSHLRSSHWGVVLDAFPGVTGWLDGLIAEDLRLHGIDTNTVEAIYAVHKHIVGLAERTAGPHSFSAQEYASQEQDLLGFLDDDLLPAQLNHEGEWADRRAILLASWAHGVGNQGPSHIASMLVDRRYQAFVDKALEMSRVLEHWVHT